MVQHLKATAQCMQKNGQLCNKGMINGYDSNLNSTIPDLQMLSHAW